MENNVNNITEPKHDAKLTVVCSAYPYNGSNGIMICCRSCGADIEETDGGYYPPIVYEHEKYERQCRQCRYS